MKIYTQNLHNYIEDNRYGKLEKMADYIYQNEIDLICLQEVGQYKLEDFIDEENNIRQGNLGVILQKILKKKYDIEYYLFCNIFKETFEYYEEGLAILSKMKPVKTKDFFVSKDTNFQNSEIRKIQKAVFSCSGETFEIFNAHIGSTKGNENALEQFRRILEHTNRENRYLIAGDSNIGQGSEEYKSILNLGIHDLVFECSPAVANQYTYYYGYKEIKSGNGRIDHILSSHPKAICSFNIFKGHEVSDHAGVMVEF